MCILDLCIAAPAQKGPFKTFRTGTRLYINDLCARAVGKITNLQDLRYLFP